MRSLPKVLSCDSVSDCGHLIISRCILPLSTTCNLRLCLTCHRECVVLRFHFAANSKVILITWI